MSTRAVQLFPIIVSTYLFLGSVLAAAPDTQIDATKENQSISPNTESPAVKIAQPDALANRIEQMTPFILTGIFNHLPEKPASDVQLIDGLDAFQKKALAEQVTAWPIAKFKSALFPPDEQAFRRALVKHAGKLGAEYVVIITDEAEIKANFQPRFERLVYCAYAYKRITALLGIDRDESAAQNGITKVSGFMKGSLAEKSGLQVGDVIRKVDGIAPADRLKYWNKFMRSKAGDKVKVEVDREGQSMEFTVELTAG